MKAEQPRDRHPQRVLGIEKWNQRHQEPEQPCSPVGELPQVGRQPQAREEQEQQIRTGRVLQGEVAPRGARERGHRHRESDSPTTGLGTL